MIEIDWVEGPGHRGLCRRAIVADARRWVEDPGRLATRADGDRPLFVKRHIRRRLQLLGDRLARRPTRARRAFEIGLALDAAGVDAARALAAIESRQPGESFTVLEFIAGRTLREVLLDAAHVAPADRRALWTRIGRSVAGLHGAGIRQRDLKAPNIIVAREGQDPRIVFIDLEGMQDLGSPPGPRLRVRDLSRLAASFAAPDVVAVGVGRDDWRRVLRAYLDAADLSAADLIDNWLAATEAWALRHHARHVASGREIV